MSNTSHVYFGRCLLLPKDAAVLSDILRLDVSDVHLRYIPSECHLIATSLTELVFRLKPLYRHAGPGQLTAQGHVAALGSLLVLQTRLEREGDRWGKSVCYLICSSELIKEQMSVWLSLTCYCDAGCGFNITVAAAVKSTVHQLCVFDGQLHDAVSISNLIL